MRFRARTRQIVFTLSERGGASRRLANRFPQRCEQRWAWMFPAWFLDFELEALK